MFECFFTTGGFYIATNNTTILNILNDVVLKIFEINLTTIYKLIYNKGLFVFDMISLISDKKYSLVKYNNLIYICMTFNILRI